MGISFILNGVPHHSAGARASITVLDLLREHLNLTGTKEGCAEGDCGACTIALRPAGAAAALWRPVNACLLLLAQLDGMEIRTVEGLGAEGAPHPVQAALAAGDGTQCGFCTPGIVMSLFAVHENGETSPDLHEVLAGNLCRCTGYRPIVAAARALAPAARGQAVAAEPAAGGILAGGTLAELSAGGELHLVPRTLEDLLAARSAHPDAVLIAGATDLGLRASKARQGFAKAIWTARVDALGEIRETQESVIIGAAVTYAAALPVIAAAFPAFGALVRRIGSRQIRAVGTLGGNLGTASPVGDTLPVLMALDAEVELRRRGGARRLPVGDFVTGYRRTALAADEVITAIHIPRLGAGEQLFAYKLSRRFDQDISTLSAAVRLRIADGRAALFRAAFGGMAERAKRAAHLEARLAGAAWTPDTVAAAASALAADFAPRGDHRGSAAYRRRAAENLLVRLVLETTAPQVPLRLEAL